MFDIIINLFICLKYSFHSDSSKRLTAGAAFAVLFLSVAGAVFTAWLSFPRYLDLLNGISIESAWFLSSGIALVMFFCLTYIGACIIKRYRDKEIIPSAFPYVCMVCLCVGGFDIVKNLEGSGDRSQEIGQEMKLTFQQGETHQSTVETDGRLTMVKGSVSTGTALPYADQIAEIKAQKADILKGYTWKGNTDFRPHPITRNSKAQHKKDVARMDKLNKDLAFWEDKQTEAITATDNQAGNHNSILREKRQSAQNGLKALSIVVYILQLILSLCWEGLAGSLYSPEKQDTQEHQQEQQAATVEANQEVKQAENVAQPTQAQGLYSGQSIGFGNSGQSEQKTKGFVPTRMHTSQKEIEVSNSHPPFTKKVQPDTYRGIDKTKYQKFVKAAKKVVETEGRYNKTAIARISGVSRRNTTKYLKIAIEKNDLIA